MQKVAHESQHKVLQEPPPLSLLHLNSFQQACSSWSPHIFSKGLTIVLMFLRCTEMTLKFQTKKQVQSPPALPSSYQKASRVFFLTKLILRKPSQHWMYSNKYILCCLQGIIWFLGDHELWSLRAKMLQLLWR